MGKPKMTAKNYLVGMEIVRGKINSPYPPHSEGKLNNATD